MIQMVVVMPSKGNKQLLNKLFKEAEVHARYTVASFFEGELVKLLKDPVGALATAHIYLRAGDNLPIEVSDINDDINDYIEMEIKQMTFMVDQPSEGAPAPAEQPVVLGSTLKRESILDLPTWSHQQRVAQTKIFAELRRRLEADKLGFVGSKGSKRSGSTG
jgi:hypothetical protein